MGPVPKCWKTVRTYRVSAECLTPLSEVSHPRTELSFHFGVKLTVYHYFKRPCIRYTKNAVCKISLLQKDNVVLWRLVKIASRLSVSNRPVARRPKKPSVYLIEPKKINCNDLARWLSNVVVVDGWYWWPMTSNGRVVDPDLIRRGRYAGKDVLRTLNFSRAIFVPV